MAIVLSFQVPRRRLGGKHIRAPPTVRGRPFTRMECASVGECETDANTLTFTVQKKGGGGRRERVRGGKEREREGRE